MSHRFHGPTAPNEARSSLRDVHRLAGSGGTTTMVMTVDPGAGPRDTVSPACVAR